MLKYIKFEIDIRSYTAINLIAPFFKINFLLYYDTKHFTTKASGNAQ